MLEPGSFSLVDLRCRHGWRFDQLCLTSDRHDSILDRHRGSTRLSQQGRCPCYGLQKQMHFGLLVSIAYSVRKPMFELPWLLVGQPALRWKRCYRVYHVLTHCLPSPINTTLKAIALESAQGQEKRSYFMCSCCCRVRRPECSSRAFGLACFMFFAGATPRLRFPCLLLGA